MAKAVKIAELKNPLSYYLRRAQRGESILVCDRDRGIARIDRVAEAPAHRSDAEWLDQLEGLVSGATARLGNWRG